MDKFLTFIFNHQLTIIEGLFAVILVVSLAWLILNLKGESADSGPSLKDVENTLKRVLQNLPTPSQKGLPAIKDDDDKPKTAAPAAGQPAPAGTATTAAPGAPQAPAAAGAAPGGATAGVPNDAELKKLQAELKAKADAAAALEKSLADLKLQLETAQKNQATSSAPGASLDELNALKKKLSEVEDRLSEYEIIEDDIANLSLYKEENTRLKNEISSIRSGAPASAPATAPSPAAAPVAAAAQVVTPNVEDIAAQALQVAPTAPAAPAAPTDPIAKMAEEDAARIASTPPPAPAPAAAPPTPPPAAPAEETAAGPKIEVNQDKLLDEFDALVKKHQEGGIPEPAGGEAGKDTGDALIAEFEAFIKEGGGG